MNYLRCESCGRFISQKEYVTYTPYGFTGIIEQPEPCFMCIKCYKKSDKELLLKTSWIKPQIKRSDKK